MFATYFTSIFRSTVPWPPQAIFFQTNSAGGDCKGTLHWSLTMLHSHVKHLLLQTLPHCAAREEPHPSCYFNPLSDL